MANTPSTRNKILDKYKNLLDTGTNEGLRYNDETKSRYVSFSKCFEHLSKIDSPIVIELGTCRSFVDGKYEGCNSDDKKYWNKYLYEQWDWGAGCFCLIFGQLLKDKGMLLTLDLMKSHLDRCKHMMQDLGNLCGYHQGDSVDFLKKTSQKFDLIYLDTGDMHPIEPTCELQLEEAKMIVERGLLNDGGLILIDDVLNGTPREQGNTDNRLGKSELSIPYLTKNGYEVIFEGYQYILKKS